MELLCVCVLEARHDYKGMTCVTWVLCRRDKGKRRTNIALLWRHTHSISTQTGVVMITPEL